MQVRLQDIADKLGVHVTTVSKALLGNPTVAAATRKRVGDTAEAMGYVADPRLRALADYRMEKRERGYRASLAWIHNHGRAEPMERFPAYGDYWQGACERAKALGYGLDRYWVESEVGGLKGLLRMLKARGVQGIVMAPQVSVCEIEGIDWRDFSVVSIGFTLHQPSFHRVSVDHYRLIRSLVRRLESEGSKRIGCYLNAEEQERTERRMIASVATCSERSDVFVKTYETPDRRSFMAWRGRNRLDTVISGSSLVVEWARAAQKPPRVVAYAYEPNAAGMVGMYHNNRLIGDHAVALLDGMLRRGERGVPEESVELLVEAKWVEG